MKTKYVGTMLTRSKSKNMLGTSQHKKKIILSLVWFTLLAENKNKNKNKKTKKLHHLKKAVRKSRREKNNQPIKHNTHTHT